MEERKRFSFGKTEKNSKFKVSPSNLKKLGGKEKIISVFLMAGVVLIAMSGLVFAEGQEVTVNQETMVDQEAAVDYFAVNPEVTSTREMSVDQEMDVSDTEQFIRWHSTAFGTAWYHWNSVQSVIEAEDGSFVAAGYSSPAENKQYTQHAYLTKFNKNGSIAWDRVYGGGADGMGSVIRYANYQFLKVIQLSNGDYLAIGQTDDSLGMSVAGYQNIFAVRIDNNGNTKWQKTFGLKDKETSINAWDAAENEDGSISIWGNYWSKYNGYDRGYPAMIELDISSGGSLLNEFSITDDFGEGATTDSGSCSMKKTTDGGFIAYQNYCISGTPWTDSIVKLNAAGQREWGFTLLPNTVTSTKRITNSKIVVMPDGYVVAGLTSIINDTESTNALIMYKIDLSGNVIWTKIYRNLTLSDRLGEVSVYKTAANDVLISVTNGYSTTDFTVLKLDDSDGSVQWVKSYGNKTGFDRDYGGNAYFKILENSKDQIIGVGNTYITKFGGDGSIAFVTDDFMAQNRTNYTVSDVGITKLDGGILEKRTYPENVVMEKDVSLLTGLSSYDIRVVTETIHVTGVTLSEETKTLTKGANFNLTATVTPENAANKAVAWSSNAEDVATVDNNGKVTAIKAGTATITVTTEDGNKTATCVVNIPAILLGDVDFSGKVQAFDALMALQIATGKIVGTPEQIQAADVGNSAKVEAFDALRILQYATGKITVF